LPNSHCQLYILLTCYLRLSRVLRVCCYFNNFKSWICIDFRIFIADNFNDLSIISNVVRSGLTWFRNVTVPPIRIFYATLCNNGEEYFTSLRFRDNARNSHAIKDTRVLFFGID